MKTTDISSGRLGKQIPPCPDHVMIWFLQKGSTEVMAQGFLKNATSTGWRNKKGEPIKDWKMAAWHWLWKNK